MELTSDHDSCVILAGLLAHHGVKHVVVSPGSRNAPLAVAVNRQGAFDIKVIIDERSAAFAALGMASISGLPTALICTSGTALLNYAPAVAEAYYRQIPLIVISADRPQEWIDQDDSQTIRQFRALDNIVKNSYDLPAFTSTDNLRWLVNRTINDAILCATEPHRGPVHINIQIDEPLGGLKKPDCATPRTISTIRPTGTLTTAAARELGRELASPMRVMVIAGFGVPSKRLSLAIQKLCTLPNVAVLTEAQSNVHATGTIPHIDTVLSALPSVRLCSLRPDVVLTFGGSILSRMVKAYLRACPDLRHWHVGINDHSIDCFQALERRIEMDPELFFGQLASAMSPHRSGCGYAMEWHRAAEEALKAKDGFTASAPWSDLRAMKAVMESVPKGCNLQLSNGTAVRYAQLFPHGNIHRIDCNRGVSGIDGCTSTAIGAAMAYTGKTLLVTGDMSAQYDLGGLAMPDIPSSMKIIVLNNGGGGIFRFIKSTSSLDELERFFVGDVRLPLRQLAEGFGFRYYEVDSESGFGNCINDFYSDDTRPALMNIITPGEVSAKVLTGYFNIKI